MPQTTPLRGYSYPCYTDAANLPAQMKTFAEDVDDDAQQLVTDLEVLGYDRPSIRFGRTTDLSVPNNADTVVEWVNTGAIPPFYPGAGSVITLPNTAIYLLSAECQWANNDAGARRLEIRRLTPVNSTYCLDVRAAGSVTDDIWTRAIVTTMVGASAGTTFEVRLRQNSGAALNALTMRINLTELSQ